MQAMLLKNRTFHLLEAKFAADELLKRLEPYCQMIETAGSIRRGVKQVHDIDLVAWPYYQETGQITLFDQAPALEPIRIREFLLSSSWAEDISIGPKIITFTFDGFPAEIYLVEPDGHNYGAMMQMRTGSAAFNIRLAMQARQKGLIYRAGYGIFKPLTGEQLDDGTELGLLKTLGISTFYLDPKNRIS
ncbi:MAG: hypothetical protein C0391_03805 [Anaerolinea sp.]|nr:hypothetical protein [Anaerolinea sp.]